MIFRKDAPKLLIVGPCEGNEKIFSAIEKYDRKVILMGNYIGHNVDKNFMKKIKKEKTVNMLGVNEHMYLNSIKGRKFYNLTSTENNKIKKWKNIDKKLVQNSILFLEFNDLFISFAAINKQNKSLNNLGKGFFQEYSKEEFNVTKRSLLWNKDIPYKIGKFQLFCNIPVNEPRKYKNIPAINLNTYKNGYISMFLWPEMKIVKLKI